MPREEMHTPKVAILGAGHGTHAMAGHLGMEGIPLRLYNSEIFSFPMDMEFIVPLTPDPGS